MSPPASLVGDGEAFEAAQAIDQPPNRTFGVLDALQFRRTARPTARCKASGPASMWTGPSTWC
jgi:hypothetical protein